MNPDNISQYCSYTEAVKSQTATRLNIDNTPDADSLRAMRFIALNIFDKVRLHIGKPLGCSSFYRSPALNNSLPGTAKKSQHEKGEAIDIDCDIHGHGTNKDVFDFIRASLPYDQIIWEYGTKDTPDWVHVSLVDEAVAGRKNRRQSLRCYHGTSGPIYVPFDLY